MFDLDTAFATWRRFLAANRALLDDDLDELESHLRDEVEDLVAEGLDEETAFRQATRRLGDYAVIERAYRDVHWKKRLHEGTWTQDLRIRGAMFTNHLKVAVRTLKRQRGVAFINGMGLATGMAAFLLLMQYASYEFSFDDFHEQSDRIYRLRNDRYQDGELIQRGVLSYPSVAKAMKADFPEVEDIVRALLGNRSLLRYQETAFMEPDLLFADPSILDVFTYPLVLGDPKTALDQPFGRAFGLFTLLAIGIACLGLFGLALFTAVQRTKELGIRKVLGASVPSLVGLLAKDYIGLLGLANLVALPLAYLGVRAWLSRYAFQMEVSLWLFVIPAVLVAVIALLTIGGQTLRAAHMNPVDSLRTE